MNARILVTGGAGYIGSHTCKALARAGYVPIVLDDLSTGHRWAVKWGPLIESDIADRVQIARVIKQSEIKAVVHFAAHAYVGESVEQPRKYFDNNVIKTLAMLDALLEADVLNIVFSSSCATYGTPQRLPIAEDHPQRPINPYGESKLFVEKVLSWYEGAYGIRYMNLRYFNAAGADPDGDIGEHHTPEIRPPRFSEQIMRREMALRYATMFTFPTSPRPMFARSIIYSTAGAAPVSI